MARSAHMNLRVRPVLKAKLEKLAKEDRRTLSAYVEKLLEDYVKSVSQVGPEQDRPRGQAGLIAPLLDLVEVAPVGIERISGIIAKRRVFSFVIVIRQPRLRIARLLAPTIAGRVLFLSSRVLSGQRQLLH